MLDARCNSALSTIQDPVSRYGEFPESVCNLMLHLARLVPEKTRSSTGQPVNDSFVYLSSLNKCNMDFQLVAGRPDTIDPLVFIITSDPKKVFYKQPWPRPIPGEDLLTGP